MKSIILAIANILCWLSFTIYSIIIIGCTQSSTGYITDNKPLMGTPTAEAPDSETPDAGVPSAQTPVTQDPAPGAVGSLAISPAGKILNVNSSFSFSASGGIPPYVFSKDAGGGTISVSGDYVAPTAATIEIIRVTDHAGTTASATVTVSQDLIMSPSNPSVNSGDSQSFSTTGGVGPYLYTVNVGGGTFVGPIYTAPTEAATGVSVGTVSILVTDILGNSASNTVIVNYDTAMWPNSPSSLSLIRPTSGTGVVNTPTIQVGGVRFGYNVSLYTDSGCNDQNLQGSASVTTGTTINITTATLAFGDYTFYAKSFNTAGRGSLCSTASINYTLSSATMRINGGAPYTLSTNATLNMPVGSSGMYITNTAGCDSGGMWEPYIATKSWVLPNTNAANSVYVKFQDAELNETSCISDSIIHDALRPVAPTGISLGDGIYVSSTTPTISWNEVTDNSGGSGVDYYQVQLQKTSDDSVVVPWTATNSGGTISGSAGMLLNNTQYYMRVRAIDKAGNVGEDARSADWTETFLFSGNGTSSSPWVPSSSASSCNQIRTNAAVSPASASWSTTSGMGQDGVYQLMVGGNSLKVYCDMTTDSGGWTLVLRGHPKQAASNCAGWNATAGTNAYYYSGSANDSTDDGTFNGNTFKFSDATINAIGGTYRVVTAGSYTATRYHKATCVYKHTTLASGDCANSCSDLEVTDCVTSPPTNSYGNALIGGAGVAGNGYGQNYYTVARTPSYQSVGLCWGTNVSSNAGNGTAVHANTSTTASQIMVWRK